MAPAVAGTKKSVRAKVSDAKQMQQFATGLRKYVQQNADYVGPNFAEEARKIHYGETPERHIYGEATRLSGQMKKAPRTEVRSASLAPAVNSG